MTPEQETDLIVEALDIAHADSPTLERTDPLEFTRREKLAVAYTIVVDRYCAIAESLETKPVQHRCGWCVEADGGDQTAWEAAPTYDAEAIRAHTKMCQLNPLVIELERLRSQLGAKFLTYDEIESVREVCHELITRAMRAESADIDGRASLLGDELRAKEAAIRKLIGDAP